MVRIPRRIGITAVVGFMAGGLVGGGAAAAKLPHPHTTLIIPGTSIAGMKLGMTASQAFHVWGSTGCAAGVCTWWGPGNRVHAERATVSVYQGHVIQIDINAGTTNGTNEKFRPGTLSKWKTARNIHLGSTKQAVKRAYPAARPNTSTGVAGYDLFFGGGIGLHYTRFSSWGFGATANRLRYIELACYLGRC
jgi:hypothetical protein